jgi:hypothetical protein
MARYSITAQDLAIAPLPVAHSYDFHRTNRYTVDVDGRHTVETIVTVDHDDTGPQVIDHRRHVRRLAVVHATMHDGSTLTIPASDVELAHWTNAPFHATPLPVRTEQPWYPADARYRTLDGQDSLPVLISHVLATESVPA